MNRTAPKRSPNRAPPPEWSHEKGHIAAFAVSPTTVVRVVLEARHNGTELASVSIARAIDASAARGTDAPWVPLELRPAGVVAFDAEQAYALAAALVAAAQELERRG